ncbi:MAG: hypothetical protein HKN14_13575 [Marinicaulis sp.]|nr:hypothetical protein [Marinicaulis sp.]NNL89519.1 hypothetical protein [Marinicaulis sp.]
MSEKRKTACRRYRIETFVAMAIYLAAVFIATQVSGNVTDQTALIALSLAPIVPMIYAVYAFFKYYRVMDERERRIASDAAALALVISVLAAITIGFMQSLGGFAIDDVMNWFGPFMIVVWSLIRIRIGGPDW